MLRSEGAAHMPAQHPPRPRKRANPEGPERILPKSYDLVTRPIICAYLNLCSYLVKYITFHVLHLFGLAAIMMGSK
jgi:hypothetical protein